MINYLTLSSTRIFLNDCFEVNQTSKEDAILPKVLLSLMAMAII
jgi:hypothetical protein